MERSLNWNDLRFFLEVARTQSLSETARNLGVSASTVARRIDVLETALRVQLFRRHHDGYEITEVGRDLLDPAESAEAQIGLAERVTLRNHESPTETVRIDVPELIGQRILLPNLLPFTRTYPNIRLDFRSSVLPVRLRAQESDIVIRLVRPERGNYRIRQVGTVGFSFYASRAYLEARGTPQNEVDLLRHSVIGWPHDLHFLAMSTWLQRVCPDMRPTMLLDSFKAHLEGVRSDFGIAVLPHFAARQEDLVPILDDVKPLELSLWALIHERAQTSSSVGLAHEKVLSILNRARSLLQRGA